MGMEMKDWEALKTVDIQTVSRNELVDIANLSGTAAEHGDREMQMKTFLEEIKNPYCFMVGDIIVKSTFSGDASLEQRIRELAGGL